MKERAKEYFLLANQYLETAKLSLNVLVENNNSTIGIASTQEEAGKKMLENVLVSDVTLFIPTLFNTFQSIELFIKGLILLKEKEFNTTHEMLEMVELIKELYGEKSNVYEKINIFYNFQIEIINSYKNTNDIETIKELYQSLRYPEDYKGTKKYNYVDLKYNWSEGIENFERLLEIIEDVKIAVLQEYNQVIE